MAVRSASLKTLTPAEFWMESGQEKAAPVGAAFGDCTV